MIRRRALLALLLLLAACGGKGDREPFTDSRIPPSLGPGDWPPAGWTWGLLQVGAAPPQRYGGAAPPAAPPIAQALMLPGYGGLAEEDFPAASALLARRIQVWALEETGQGGSGRMAGPRDLGYVRDFGADVAAIAAMADRVIRPAPGQALVAVADRTAAPVALRALQQDPSLFAALVLTDPSLDANARAIVPGPLARWLGLDRRRWPGERGWRRQDAGGPPGSPGWRRQAWRTANPDLRMGGPSLSWLAAFSDLTRGVRRTGFAALRLPVLALADPAAPKRQRDAAQALCGALPRCTFVAAPADRWPTLEGDFIAAVARVQAPVQAAALPIGDPDR
jgi:lysophospholipase